MNNQNPLFSIIIPTYNYAHYLPDTVSSVLQQSGSDYELIVINDGSTDNTDDVAAKLLEDNKFIYCSRENRGASATRNQGLTLAKGQYVYFLDSDDKLLDDALQTFRETIKNNDSADMLIARYFSVDKTGKKKERCLWTLPGSREENVKKYLLNVDYSLLGSSIIYRKHVFDRYQFPEHLRLYEDEPVFSYVLANFNAIKIEKPVALIQKHEDSLRHRVYHGLVEKSVDEIFSPVRMPESLMKYRNEYLGIKYLDQFRTLYLAGLYKDAWNQFIQAYPLNSKAALRLNFLRKAIKSWLRK